jgi:CheY-like chemotaxis protein
MANNEGNGGLPKILLVEDNAENRDVMSHFLKKSCDVDVAHDAPTAIEKAKSAQYRLILMDINLGLGMNGMEATKEIRKMPGYDSIPIIAVTAYAMAGDREVFMEAGCSHYISKPFTKKEFVGIVEEALQEAEA